MKPHQQNKGQRGSINIFVALMIVPVMAFTGLMIDFARINMTSAIVHNSASLAANSALSHFDSLLLDTYGLLATTQNTDSIQRFAESAVRATLATNNQADRGNLNLLGRVQDIEVSVNTGGTNLHLNNMAYLRRQILDFMALRVIFSFFDPETQAAVEEAAGELENNNMLVEGGDNEDIDTTQADNERRYVEAIANGNNSDILAIGEGVLVLHYLYEDIYKAIIEAESETRRAELESTRQWIVDEIERLEGVIEAFELAIEIYQAMIASLEASVASAQSALSSLSVSNAASEEEASNIASQISNLESAIENYQNQIAIANAGIALAQYGIEVARAEISDLRSEWEELVKVFVAYFEKVRDLTAQVEEQRGVVTQLFQNQINYLNQQAANGTFSQGFVDNMLTEFDRDGLNFIYPRRNQPNPDDNDDTTTPDAGPVVQSPSGFKAQAIYRLLLPVSLQGVGASYLTVNNTHPLESPVSVTEFRNHDSTRWHELIVVAFYEPELEHSQDDVNQKLADMQETRGDDNGENDEASIDNEEDGDPSDHERPNLRDLPDMPSAFNRTDRPNNGAHETNFIQGLTDGMVSRALLAEYALGMFTNFTTNRVLRSTDDGPARNPAGTYDISLSNIPFNNTNGLNFWFGAEVEYLIAGQSSAQANFNRVQNELRALRFVDNMRYTFQSQHLRRETRSIRKIPKVGWALSLAYRLGVTATETHLDMEALRRGQRVPILKRRVNGAIATNNRSEFRTGIHYTPHFVAGRSIWGGSGEGTNRPGTELPGRGLYYYQYLRLRLMMVNPDRLTQRIANLIEFNLNYHKSLQAGGSMSASREHFMLENAFVVAEITVQASAPNYFIGTGLLGLGTDYRLNRFTVTARRGY